MKNKFRRSMTSVLLAASLLFSSQSVVAFADYGSKSDTSDLSPVQESVEPVIGESTEAPVAAPMMARANAPVAYSAPEVSGYSLYRYYDYFNEPEPDTVSVYITDGVENYGTVYESAYEIGRFDAFTSGSSWQSYTIDANSFKNNDWIFKGWSYKLTQNNDNHDLGNITDNAVGRRYTFGDGRNSVDAWCHQYNGGETISIHALWRTGLLGSHIEEKSTLHHSIYANFNPLVTVDVGENGKVTYNGTVVDKDTTDKKVEVEYGTAPDFTITPDTGYKVASVTFGDDIITADEDGTYFLSSVTEPTTLYVEFEKAEDEDTITKDKIVGAVIVTVACDNLPEHTHQYSLSVNGTDDGEYPNYKITKTSDESAILHLLKDGWLHTFVSQPGHGGHSLVDSSSNYINIELTFDEASGKWKLPDDAKLHDVTINVKCSDVQENVVVYACYDGVMEEQPIFQGKASHGSKLIDYLKEQELKIKEGYTIEEGWYKKDSFPNEYLFNESDTVSGWTNVYVKCFKNPDENIINNLLDVTLNCENPDHPVEYDKSKTYSDLLPNSYTIGEVKNNDGTYTCDITINPEEYLADYNNVTKTNHILVTTPENLTGIATVTLKYEDGAWKTAESPVTFTVTCKQSIPLTPSKPSDDDVKAIMNKISVTVDCTNTTGHDPMNHTLTGAEFTVGDIYSVAPFASKDPVILCPVTINNYVSLQNGFITHYNAATNESHTLSSGFIPASIVLTYNKDAQDGKGAWENHDLENITLSLTCNPTTPGGGGEGTNPGGNGGDNDDDDDRYTGDNTVTRTINDDDVPLNDRPTNTTTIDDEDVPLADLPDDTVTIDDGEVPLKANPSTGDSLPFAAMAAAALSLGGVIVLNRKKK